MVCENSTYLNVSLKKFLMRFVIIGYSFFFFFNIHIYIYYYILLLRIYILYILKTYYTVGRDVSLTYSNYETKLFFYNKFFF